MFSQNFFLLQLESKKNEIIIIIVIIIVVVVVVIITGIILLSGLIEDFLRTNGISSTRSSLLSCTSTLGFSNSGAFPALIALYCFFSQRTVKEIFYSILHSEIIVVDIDNDIVIISNVIAAKTVPSTLGFGPDTTWRTLEIELMATISGTLIIYSRHG